MSDLKQEIMMEIERKSSVCKRCGLDQWRIRCPLCGDSQKDFNHAHCYIKCSEDPSEPLLYYCFRCNSHGRVNAKFLEKLNVKPELISMIGKQKYNRIGVFTKANVNIVCGDPIISSPQMAYIEHRLGKGFNENDLNRFKIVWDMNNVRQHVKERVAHALPTNHSSISFLSDDMSMLITRTFEENAEESQWNKQKLFVSPNKSFYTIKSAVDLFTPDTITVNIAEGIFDVLSIFKNFCESPADIFIATLGSNYISAVDYAISKGFIGSNVILKIYIDWEVDERSLRYGLKKYKWLFREIHIYRNVLYKDVGVRLDRIKLSEIRI